MAFLYLSRFMFLVSISVFWVSLSSSSLIIFCESSEFFFLRIFTSSVCFLMVFWRFISFRNNEFLSSISGWQTVTKVSSSLSSISTLLSSSFEASSDNTLLTILDILWLLIRVDSAYISLLENSLSLWIFLFSRRVHSVSPRIFMLTWGLVGN